VIFGMMRVINLAHGEFLMLALTALFLQPKQASIYGLPCWWLPLFVWVCLALWSSDYIIRHLYGRMVDTMLATWGLSLLCVGLVTSVFGNTTSVCLP
jgi:branched-chain amino acid transport system permease protein